MYPHRIRLRDPWEQMLGDDGRVVWRRFFHAPTISAGERVFLVGVGLRAAAVVHANGTKLGEWAAEEASQEVEFSPWLAPRNELTLTCAAAEGVDATLPWTEIRLEIRGP